MKTFDILLVEDDEDMYPDIDILARSDISMAFIDEEIYNIILFDYKDYIISSKVYDFIEKNGNNK